MSRTEIQKILRSLLVQSYCWLKEFDSAQAVADGIDDREEKEELNKNIKAHLPKEVSPVGTIEKAPFAGTAGEMASVTIEESTPVGGGETRDDTHAATKWPVGMIGVLSISVMFVIICTVYKKRRRRV